MAARVSKAGTLDRMERALIRAVVKAVNEKQLSKAEARIQRSTYLTRPKLIRDDGPPLSAEMLSMLVADRAAAELDWNQYWTLERTWIRSALSAIAAGKRPLPIDLDQAVSSFEANTRVEPTVEFDAAGRPAPVYLPKFASIDAAAGYAVLRLAATGNTVHLGECRRCGNFFTDERRGRGRKRSDFCSDAHRNAFGAQKFRDEQRRPSRHK